MEEIRIKCIRCNQYKNRNCFLSKNCRVVKNCNVCRQKALEQINETKCNDHNRIESQCRECSNPVKKIVINMVKKSKFTDKQNGKYDPVNFVDKCFIENMIDDCNDRCYYCEERIQYVHYDWNLATIERLDNSLGHIKSNVVIACRDCNLQRVGNYLNRT